MDREAILGERAADHDRCDTTRCEGTNVLEVADAAAGVERDATTYHGAHGVDEAEWRAREPAFRRQIDEVQGTDTGDLRGTRRRQGAAAGGDAIAWKGRLDEELPGARKACAAIGGEIVKITPTSELGLGKLLPGRSLVVIRKLRGTPTRYPRSAAEAKRRPW